MDRGRDMASLLDDYLGTLDVLSSAGPGETGGWRSGVVGGAPSGGRSARNSRKNACGPRRAGRRRPAVARSLTTIRRCVPRAADRGCPNPAVAQFERRPWVDRSKGGRLAPAAAGRAPRGEGGTSTRAWRCSQRSPTVLRRSLRTVGRAARRAFKLGGRTAGRGLVGGRRASVSNPQACRR